MDDRSATDAEGGSDRLDATLKELAHSRDQIRRAHDEWRVALDAFRDPVFMHDADCRILRSNRAYAERAGMSVKDVIGKPYWEAFPKGEGPFAECCGLAAHDEVLSDGGDELVREVLLDSGETYMSRSYVVRDESGDYLYSLHIMEDITERKRSEAKLQLFRRLLDHANDAIEVVDHKTLRFLDVNDATCRKLGYSREELMAMSIVDVAPDLNQAVREMIEDKMERAGGAHFEGVHKRKDGSVFPVDINASLVRLDRDYGVAIVRDITQRKRVERRLKGLNRTLQMLSECNQTLIRAHEESQLLQDMCRVIVETGGYHAAWVGYVDHVDDVGGRHIRPVAQCGQIENYLEGREFIRLDGGAESMPVVQAVLAEKMQASSDERFSVWRQKVQEKGGDSCIALPLKHDNGEVFGSLSIYSDKAEAFDKAQMKLLQEMSEDLAFGIQTLRMREAQKHSTELLARGLEETVQVIATMVEMRDPYTNGHQQRVADLAVAIAREMMLPEDQVRGIHLAGEIHDLGKIQTPAEILSKPGRLSNSEFELIKTHPQTGYEVLKNISFPWPIAQIVLQHHERLDGSGYPQGLIGDQILLEARILIVADVVEAMSSHRPYRPGLGLQQALDEIRRNRGRFYDPQVVDACIRLFEEKRYQAPDSWAAAG